MNTLENSTKHKTKVITVLNTRETRITSKLSMDMASPPWKLHLEALFLTKISLRKWKEVLAAYGAHQRVEVGMRNKR
jgi:hypothetical protein